MKKSNIFGKRLASLVTAFVLALGFVPADITMRPLFGIEASAEVIEAYTVTVTNGTTDKAAAAAGDSITVTATVPTGKQFKEWTVTSGGITLENTSPAAFTMPASNVAITAVFEDIPAVTYTVAFNKNDGSEVTVQTVTGGSKIEKPADPTRDGYTFGGWYTDENCTNAFDFNTEITENITLYAKWTAVFEGYTVTFNSMGGSSVSPVTANSDGYIEVPPTPTRDGYTFGGWYDDSACTTAHDFYTPLSSDVTLYAKWISNHTHSYGSTWKSDSTEHWHECSCGTKSGTAAHTEDEGVITTEPTTTSTGVKTYSCSVCGYVMRTETVDKLHTHSYGTEWKYDSTSHWVECSCGTKSGTAAHVSNGGIITTEPTSTSVGTKIYSCSVCGYIMRTETIPASGNGSYGDSGNNSGNNSGSNSNSGSDGAGNAGSYTGGKSEENTDNNSGGKSENEQPSETEEIIADEAADEEIEEIKETVPPKKVTKLKAKVKKNSKSPKVKKNSKSQKKKTGAIVTLSWRETDKNADGFLVEMYDPYKKKWIKKKLIKVEDDDYGSFHCTISGVGKGKISKKEYKFRITPYTEDENGEKVYGKSTTIKEKI